MKNSNKNLIEKTEETVVEITEPAAVKSENEGETITPEETPLETPRMYTQQEMAELTEAAYLRGRNEQIESQFVADTSHLTETDGIPPEPNPATDGTWIHTRSSVWQ